MPDLSALSLPPPDDTNLHALGNDAREAALAFTSEVVSARVVACMYFNPCWRYTLHAFR